MNNGAKHRVEGLAGEARGHAESAVGEATGDERLKHEGHLEHLKGKVEDGIGDLKDAADDHAPR